MDGFFSSFYSFKGAAGAAHRRREGGAAAGGTLARFGAELTVVAPEILPAFTPLARCLLRTFRPEDVREGYRLVIVASSDREANRTAGERARALGIPVSVADAKEESTFFFPAVIEGGGIVAGLISEGGTGPPARGPAGGGNPGDALPNDIWLTPYDIAPSGCDIALRAMIYCPADNMKVRFADLIFGAGHEVSVPTSQFHLNQRPLAAYLHLTRRGRYHTAKRYIIHHMPERHISSH